MGLELVVWLLVLTAVGLPQKAQAKVCPASMLRVDVDMELVQNNFRADKGIIETGLLENNNLLCSAFGNFHYKTFDGDVYYFPANCTYLFCSNCKSSFDSFTINLRHAIVNGIPTISFITLKINGLLFTINKDKVTVDGTVIQLPYKRSWIEIKTKNGYVTVAATIGLSMTWNQEDSLHLELDTKFSNQTCGLCGDFNGVPIYNELIINGVQLSPYEYGLLQKVQGPTETCNDAPEFIEDLCLETDSVCENLFDGIDFFSCQSLIDALPYIETCIQDQCRCKASDSLKAFCFCSTVEEYSRQCADSGGKPLNWRTPDMCPKVCPPGMEYQECGPWTVESCSSRGVAPFLQEHCLAGCFCVQGTILDDVTGHGCILPDQCYCIYNGKIYPSGGVYSNPCQRCQCSNGQWICMRLPCPGFCSIEGGSHITTFDELTYKFHGQCQYVLSQPCADSSFIVMGALVQCGLTDMETCLKDATVVINNSTIIDIDTAGTVLVNWTSVQLPITAADFSVFRPSSFFIIVNLNLGLQLQIQLVPTMQLYIQVEPRFQGKLCGLCGNFNNIQGDEFTDASGMVQGTAAAFANSWKGFSRCPDTRNVFEDPCVIHNENEQYAYEYCDLLINPQGSFAACHYIVNPALYHKNCLFDTCVCKDNEECLCAAISSYVRTCAMKGVFLTDWRTNVCSKYSANCSNTMVYSYIISSCQPSCRSLTEIDATCGIHFVPVDGCVCPDGHYLDPSGLCVLPSHCSCYYQGSVVPSGGTIDGNGVQCTCREGQIRCVISEGCTPPQTYFNCSNVAPGSPGSECQKSCQTLAVPCLSRQCISGCMCPENMVLDGRGGCVPTELCPCFFNGRTYQSGETIQVSCNTCTCIKEAWDCTKMSCLGTCTTYGEGNFQTFDNRRYRFNGDCEYILSQDFCGNLTRQSTFRVTIETVPCSSSGRTCAKTVHLYLGTYSFTFKDAKFTVVDTHSGVSLIYKIRYMGIYLVVEASNGMAVLWDKKTTIFVKLEVKFMGSVCGLCGNYDGNSVNDFTTQTHSVVEDVVVFGNSWKLSPTCPDVKPTPDPCLGEPTRKYWAQKQCSIILSSVFSKCHSQIDPVPFYEICVTDTCGCDIGGDCECFCTAVAAYSHACIDTGVCVYWRSPEICPMFCDYYNTEGECEWHYKPCGAPCMKTCRNPSGVCLYTLAGLEGCYPKCPPDKPYFDEDKNKCVAQCGCYDNEGNRYEYGEKMDLCINCQICNCTMNGITCIYDVQACYCVYNGLIYKYGEQIFSYTASMGMCVNVTCGANGELKNVSYPCLPTSTTMFTVTSSYPTSTSTPMSTSTVTSTSTTRSTSVFTSTSTPSSTSTLKSTSTSTPSSTSKYTSTITSTSTATSTSTSTSKLTSTSTPSSTSTLKSTSTPTSTSTPSSTSTSISTSTFTSTSSPAITSSTQSTTTECNYEVCEWSMWYDISYPQPGPTGGDFETFVNIRASGYAICDAPKEVNCRATLYPNVTMQELGQNLTCSLTSGLICYNKDQISGMCYNYEIAILCCRNVQRCTSTARTTLTSTSVSTSTSSTTSTSKLTSTSTTTSTATSISTPTSTSIPTSTTTSTSTATSRSSTTSTSKLTSTSTPSSTSTLKSTSASTPSSTSTTTSTSTLKSTSTSTPSSTSIPTSITTSTSTATSTSSTTFTPKLTSTSTPSSTSTLKSTSTPTSTSTPSSTSTSISTSTFTSTSSPAITSSTQSTTTECNYEVCEWSMWYDISYPQPGPTGGDFETFVNIRASGYAICDAPKEVNCRATFDPNATMQELGQNLTCSLTSGLICYNKDQISGMCYNYEITILCCRNVERCTSTTRTTLTSTSVSTSTSSTTSTSKLTSTSTTTSTATSTSTPTSTSIPTSTTTSTSTATSRSSTTSTSKLTSTSTPSSTSTLKSTSASTPSSTSTTTSTSTLKSTSTSTPSSTSIPTSTTTSTSTATPTSSTTFTPKLTSTSTPSSTSTLKSTSTPTSTSTPSSTSTSISTSTFTSTSSPTITSSTQSTTTECNYEVCEWSMWYDISYPQPGPTGGDFETFVNIRASGYAICDAPKEVNCRATLYPNATMQELGQNLTCSLSSGLICYNKDQISGMCYNYEITILCCRYVERCTSTTRTTLTSTSVSTSTSSTTSTSKLTSTSTTTSTATSTSTPTSTSIPTSTTTSTSTATPTSSTTFTPKLTSTSTPSSTSTLKSTSTPTSTSTPSSTSTSISTSTFMSTSSPAITSSTQSTTTECNYEVCEWSMWYDISYPQPGPTGGDFETFVNIRASGYAICDAPKEVNCRATLYPNATMQELGQNLTCSLTSGLICYNKDQISGMCYNYEITILCCRYVERCTSTTRTTLTSTSVSTSTSSTTSTSKLTSTSTTTSTATSTSTPTSTSIPTSTTTSTSTATPTSSTTFTPKLTSTSTPSSTSTLKSTSTPTSTTTPSSTSTSISTSTFTSTSSPAITSSTQSTTTECNYEVCEWSMWYDISYPQPGPTGGDFETFVNIRASGYAICDAPKEVNCRATLYPNATMQELGQNLTCSLTSGLICYNKDQISGMCYNYEITILCCRYVERCTSTTRTTLTSTSVSTSTSSTTSTSKLTSTSTTTSTATSTSTPTSTSIPTSTTTSTSTATPTSSTTFTPKLTSTSTPSSTSTLKSTSTPTSTSTPSSTSTSISTSTFTSTSSPAITSSTQSTTTECNYEVCEWSMWYDISYPQPGPTGGDFETFVNIRASGYAICDAPKEVNCRATLYPNATMQELGQNLTCSLTSGLICYNKDQISGMCYNYEITILCCRYVERCTSTTRTTLTSTSVSTSTSSTTSTSKLTSTSTTTSTATSTSTPTSTSIPTSTTTSTSTATSRSSTTSTSKLTSTSTPSSTSTLKSTSTSTPSSTSIPTSTTTSTSTATPTSSTTFTPKLTSTSTPSSSSTLKSTSTPTSTSTPSSTSTSISTSTFTSTSSPAITSSTQSTTTECNYEVCEWSMWYDISYPQSGPTGGDFETFVNIRASGYAICDAPKEVNCRATLYPNVTMQELGQNLTCSVRSGLICYNKDQTSGLCYNYEIKLLCCRTVQRCTSTASTTLTATSTSTSASSTTSTLKLTSTSTPTSTSTSTSTSKPTLTSSPTSTLTTTSTSKLISTSTPSSTSTLISSPTSTSTSTATYPTTSISTPTFTSTSTFTSKLTSTSTQSSALSLTSTYTTTSSSTPVSTTTPCVYEDCKWTPWYDVSYPQPGSESGDFETFEIIRSKDYIICSSPKDINCRATLFPNTPLNQLNQTVQCNKTFGLTCYNNQQPSQIMCYNYEIQVYCCQFVPCQTSTVKPTMTACMCYYNGMTFSPGDVVYNQTGSNGCVTYGICNTKCEIDNYRGPCYSTTTVSTTTTPATTTSRLTTSTASSTQTTTTSSSTKEVSTTKTPPIIHIINCTNAVCAMYGNSTIMTITCPAPPIIECENGASPKKVYDPDQCCYHYECQYCTGPYGERMQPGHYWKSNCNNCTCSKNYTIECMPLLCATATEAPCNKEGFESIKVATPNDTCCSTVECRCNPSLCQRPLNNCDVGFQMNVSFDKGDCCAAYVCVSKDVCVVNGIEYPPLSPIPTKGGACNECNCTAEKNPSTQLNMVNCEPITCNSCQPGYAIVKNAGDCCGTCVQVACVMNKADGTQEIHMPGEVWRPPGENCTVYTCDQTGSTFSLVVEKAICSPFVPELCQPGTIQMTPDGCCQTCQVNVTQPCSLLIMSVTASVGQCSGTIDVGYCSGPCMGSSMYDVTIKAMVHQCSCCTEVEMGTKESLLACENGESISYSYDTVLQCGCKTADCIH